MAKKHSVIGCGETLWHGGRATVAGQIEKASLKARLAACLHLPPFLANFEPSAPFVCQLVAEPLL